MSEASGWEGARTRSSLVPVALVLLAVVAVAWLLRAGDGEDAVGPDGEQVDRADRGELAIEGRAGEDGPLRGEAGGRWQLLESAPVPAPRRHHAVYTGRELVVFGAAGQVAAYDARHRLWWQREPVPGPGGDDGGPAVLREPSVDPVWTGSEVLVLTGPRSDAADAAMAAAAFDPAADRWRTLPSPPVTIAPPAASLWTGDRWFVWGRAGGRRVREDGPPVGAVYDPLTDTWRRVAEPPLLLVEAAGGVVTDRDVVVWGQRPGRELRAAGEGAFALRYDVDADRWDALPPPPLSDPARAVAAWTGSCLVPEPGDEGCGQVLLWGAPVAGPDPASAPAAGARLDVAAGRWSPLPSVAGLAGPGGAELAATAGGAWTGERLLVVGGPGAVGLVLDRSATWRRLPPRDPLLAPALAWTGAELLVWGGHTSGGSSSALRAWRPPRRSPVAGLAHPD